MTTLSLSLSLSLIRGGGGEELGGVIEREMPRLARPPLYIIYYTLYKSINNNNQKNIVNVQWFVCNRFSRWSLEWSFLKKDKAKRPIIRNIVHRRVAKKLVNCWFFCLNLFLVGILCKRSLNNLQVKMYHYIIHIDQNIISYKI